MTDLDFDPNHISQTSDGRYFLLPFNEYQLGNLLGAIKRAEYNGDWWWEIVTIVGTTMQKYGLTLGSNWGDEFSINNLEALEPTNHARQLSHLRGGTVANPK